MKIAIVTDTHCGARSDSDVFNEYFLKFFNEVFFPYLEEHNIKTIIHGGDVFDRRKYCNFKTLRSWHDHVFPKLNKYDTHIVVGNHDCYYRNTNNVNSVDQLLDQYNYNVYINPQEINIDGLDILLLPWINEENYESSMEMINTTQAQVCIGHLEIKGFDMFAGQTNIDHGFNKSLFNKFDLVFSGHFHHKSDDGSIYYLGSPYPMTWADYGDKRGFHIFDTETRELEFIENPYKIFDKVYYNDETTSYEDLMNFDFSSVSNMYIKLIVQEKNHPSWFEQFIDKMNENNPSDISVVESFIEFSNVDEEELDQSKNTLTLLTEYVEELGIKNNKKEIVQLMKDLWAEAINQDISGG